MSSTAPSSDRATWTREAPRTAAAGSSKAFAPSASRARALSGVRFQTWTSRPRRRMARTKFDPRRPVPRNASTLVPPGWVQAVRGQHRNIGNGRHTPASAGGDVLVPARRMTVLQVADLRFGYAGDALFENVTFSLAIGDRVALVAPNGSGKTTLLRIVAGEMEPDRGS